ncbi:MAG: FHA domain-containing protein [Myxococcota bacterium]
MSYPNRDHSLDGTHLAAAPAHRPFDARTLFERAWDAVRRAVERAKGRVGVTLLLVDDEGHTLGETWIAASLDVTRTAVVGRHPRCALSVPGSERALPLRHLAVLVRAENHEDVAVRILDLHTEQGFGDEAGRSLQAARFTGSAFLAVGSLRLLVLETHKLEVSDGVEKAYASIPGRVFREEEVGAFRPGPRLVRPRQHDGEMTQVLSQLGPLSATARLLQDDETARGHVTLGGLGMAVTRPVGPEALRRGILIGRYSRCDVRTGADSPELSRVHAILLEERGEILLVDAGSSNGTWAEGREMSVVRLDRLGEAWLSSPRKGLGVLWE